MESSECLVSPLWFASRRCPPCQPPPALPKPPDMQPLRHSHQSFTCQSSPPGFFCGPFLLECFLMLVEDQRGITLKTEAVLKTTEQAEISSYLPSVPMQFRK